MGMIVSEGEYGTGAGERMATHTEAPATMPTTSAPATSATTRRHAERT